MHANFKIFLAAMFKQNDVKYRIGGKKEREIHR